MFIEYVAYDGARFANKDDCKCYELENNVIFCKTIEKDDKVVLQKITIKELINDNDLVEDVDLIVIQNNYDKVKEFITELWDSCGENHPWDDDILSTDDVFFKTEDGDWVSLFGEYEYIMKIITQVLKFDGIKEKKGW